MSDGNSRNLAYKPDPANLYMHRQELHQVAPVRAGAKPRLTTDYADDQRLREIMGS
jgi:hypothetical protein